MDKRQDKRYGQTSFARHMQKSLSKELVSIFTSVYNNDAQNFSFLLY